MRSIYWFLEKGASRHFHEVPISCGLGAQDQLNEYDWDRQHEDDRRGDILRILPPASLSDRAITYAIESQKASID